MELCPRTKRDRRLERWAGEVVEGRGGVEFHTGEEPRGRGRIQGASGCAKSGEQGGKSRQVCKDLTSDAGFQKPD